MYRVMRGREGRWDEVRLSGVSGVRDVGRMRREEGAGYWFVFVRISV
jgi:hypothetical protein